MRSFLISCVLCIFEYDVIYVECYLMHACIEEAVYVKYNSRALRPLHALTFIGLLLIVLQVPDSRVAIHKKWHTSRNRPVRHVDVKMSTQFPSHSLWVFKHLLMELENMKVTYGWTPQLHRLTSDSYLSVRIKIIF
jgi:hypothetical protein